MTAPSLLDEIDGVVAYAWRKDGMKGWALGHNPPTQNMLDFDKYEVRELAFRTHHAEIADMARRLDAAERDAARYRWLRNQATAGVMTTPCHGSLNCDEPESEWDAWIDAAAQEGEG